MIETLQLFRPLHKKLIALLESLDHEDWNRNTVAGNWTVKDVTAHLLDTMLRSISLYRDKFSPPAASMSYQELVIQLNRINSDWVVAMQRVSPKILIEWLNGSHESYISCLEQLDLHAPARYGVAWAGEEVSTNWFHIAREYTERWHHQQQIREAVGQQEILTREFYYPALDTFICAMPFQYRNIIAPEGTRILLRVDSEAGGTWQLNKKKLAWVLTEPSASTANVEVTISARIAWKLFTKALDYRDSQDGISIHGDKALAIPVLQMISVIA